MFYAQWGIIMTNEEIGTYQLCEAIEIDPKLKVIIDNNTLTASINGTRFVGNFAIIKACVSTSKLSKRKTLIDREVTQKRNSKKVLSDIFGISKDLDKKLVYDEDEVWKIAQKLVNSEKVKKKVSNFKLDTNEDRGLI